MKGMKTLALALMAMAAMESGNNGGFREREPKIRMRFNPKHKHKPVRKYLHEFSINGEKVMAYSRKNAITRLRHKK